MSLLNAEFNGLADEDFDVYQRQCWSNNRFNLDRMRTKERVQHLAKSMVDELQLDGVRLEASSEIPSVWNGREVKEQWVFLVRDDEARRHLQPLLAKRLDLATRIKAPADHLKHIFIGLRLDADVLEISLRLSRYAVVDIENTMGRVDSDLEALSAAIDGLGDSIQLNEKPATSGSFMTAIRELQEGHREWLTLGQSIKRDEATQLGAGIVATIAQVCSALGAVFRFCAWSETNDHVGMASQLSEVAEARESVEKEREAHRERKAALHAKRAEEARARTSSKVAAEEAWRQMQARRRPKSESTEDVADGVSTNAPLDEPRIDEARAKASKSSSRRSSAKTQSPKTFQKPRSDKSSKTGADRSAHTKASTPKTEQRRAKKKDAPTFNVGDNCRLSRGIFAGKEGVITGLGKPGYYSVKVGILEVNVSAFDLELAGN